jgi:hypothetical protein
MQSKSLIKIFTLFLFACATTLILAGPDKKVEKSFEGMNKVKIKLAISDCILKSSVDNKIHATVTYSYSDDEYEVVFRESANSVTLQEKFHGEDVSGSAEWIVSVPKDIKVDVNSGTGDLILSATESEVDGNTGTGDIELTDASGEFELNSGTGSVTVKSSEGDFDLNSGTGKVRIKDSKGNFNANSGTGSVQAQKITFSDEGEFNSGTGDVEIIGPMGDDYDLSLNSGTGDAILDMDGAELSGYFEFKAGLDRGRIKADIEFDREEEQGHKGNGTIVKSVKIKNDSPRFFISTGNGTAELKK